MSQPTSQQSTTATDDEVPGEGTDPADLSEAVLSIPLDSLPELGMAPLTERVSDAGILDLSELVCSGGGCVLHVVTEEPLPATELQELPFVAWWESIHEEPGRSTAIGKVQSAADETAVDPPAEHDVAATEHGVHDGRLSISLVGDRADVAERVREYHAAGAHPTLERLGPYDGASHPLDALTDRQETVLREARRQGYFEVPREATTEEVATALDLDDSTVSEHLQRAQRSLLNGVFEA